MGDPTFEHLSPMPQAKPRRRRRAVLAAAVAGGVLVIVAALVLVGFLGRGLFSPSNSYVTIEDERLAVDLTLPEGMGITHVSAPVRGECGYAGYAFDQGLTIEMYAAGCGEPRNDRGPLNGFHGAYRSLDDVDEPRDVEQVDTQLGTADVFTQEYTECTNFCKDYDEPVAIIRLDDPADPGFPSLVLRSEKGELSREELIEILATMRSLDRVE